MNSFLSKSFAVALGLASAFALTPAMAAPAIHLAPSSVPDANPRLIQVQNTPGSPQSGLDFYRNAQPRTYRNHGSYNHRRHYQHRYNHRRHGRQHYRHRHHDNGAGVVGGLIAGAIIGGIAANAMSNGGGNAHVNWCYNRYRSYRASDNTFQPYHGPRRQCVSPY